MSTVRCSICGSGVTDEILQHVWYDPKNPEIDIGPYCKDCLFYIRMCSTCHTPFVSGDGTLKGYRYRCCDCS